MILGIESTAHTIGLGMFDGRTIKHFNSTYSRPFGGMKPSEVADHHSLVFRELLMRAKGEWDLTKVRGVAFSQGPGMAAPLRVGRAAALYLAKRFGVPVIPVHHSVAHIMVGVYLGNLKDPLIVYVSGGNTQILIMDKGFRVLGETLDMGLGNAIDNLARAMHLERAHGGEVERLAREGHLIDMPYVVKGMDFSFSGLLTFAEKALAEQRREDVAYSFQEHAFSMIAEAAERALMITGKEEVLLCGGVAQNKRFKEILRGMCEENGVRFYVPPDEFNRDNGGMIAYTGHYMLERLGDRLRGRDLNIRPLYRIEEVKL